ncbi:hypothetical protein D3C84_1151230 [compost metagenome]
MQISLRPGRTGKVNWRCPKCLDAQIQHVGCTGIFHDAECQLGRLQQGAEAQARQNRMPQQTGTDASSGDHARTGATGN